MRPALPAARRAVGAARLSSPPAAAAARQVFCNNYLDGGYHVPFAHGELASGIDMDTCAPRGLPPLAAERRAVAACKGRVRCRLNASSFVPVSQVQDRGVLEVLAADDGLGGGGRGRAAREERVLRLHLAQHHD